MPGNSIKFYGINPETAGLAIPLDFNGYMQ